MKTDLRMQYAVTKGQNQELLAEKYFCVDIDIST